ncbi:hypothetical protein Pmani_003810 [Petrolisthes manimaculis]|uniref:Uncharacterized protein n=1 Tax=Petrolisthes manimaculis TaxID=1843537 RepID=A0AAE1QHT0_9EUCA|nr:hypothetical protein Pmani_003810 [Petrolisthes manimaculis]
MTAINDKLMYDHLTNTSPTHPHVTRHALKRHPTEHFMAPYPTSHETRHSYAGQAWDPHYKDHLDHTDPCMHNTQPQGPTGTSYNHKTMLGPTRRPHGTQMRHPGIQVAHHA